jgi:NADH-quinone oxidoreductase subunit N
VYQGAPTAITLLIGTVPEFAAFAMMLRLLAGALGAPEMQIQWQGMLAILALLSVTLGHVVAIAQTNLKRMLAYSTIANMGYVLMGFLGADASGYTGGDVLHAGLRADEPRLVRHDPAAVARRIRGGPDRRSQGAQSKVAVVGVHHVAGDVSLAGMPPTIGFYGKLLVLQAAIKAGFVWLAVVGVLAALVGAFYYLRIVKLMYFDEPVDRAPIEARGDARWLLSGTGWPCCCSAFCRSCRWAFAMWPSCSPATSEPPKRAVSPGSRAKMNAAIG